MLLVAALMLPVSASAEEALKRGGAQAIATMAVGLFTGKSADDMTIAVDLLSQAEHRYDSPVWLFTDSIELVEKVLDVIPPIIADMPNPEVPEAFWRDYGEIVLCRDREELCRVNDEYAAAHVQIMADDLDRRVKDLSSYGSLFLGEGRTVPDGDQRSGTNHILSTKKAGHYSGRLNVMKFLNIYTYQEVSQEANRMISGATSRLSRVAGMEGHARACDRRLRKYFPGQEWDFEVYEQTKY